MVSWDDEAQIGEAASTTGSHGIFDGELDRYHQKQLKQNEEHIHEEDENNEEERSLRQEEKEEIEKEVRNMFRLVRCEKWEELIESLNRERDESEYKKKVRCEILRNTIDDEISYDIAYEEEGSTLLHTVAACTTVPMTVIETMFRHSDKYALPSWVTFENKIQQTPLHISLYCMAERTDIVQCLLNAAPYLVHHRDVQRLRPIDIVCQKIIMAEEVIKYSGNGDDATHVIDSLWSTVHALAGAACQTKATNNSCTTGSHLYNAGTQQSQSQQQQSQLHENEVANERSTQQQPLVHACLQVVDFPFALTQRALVRYSNQLREPNSNGDLPLHIIAGIPPPPSSSSRSRRSLTTSKKVDDGNDDEMELDDADDSDEDADTDDIIDGSHLMGLADRYCYDENDILSKILMLNSSAAYHRNHQDEIPLVIGKKSGRCWKTGMFKLLTANPYGIVELDVPYNLYSILLYRLSISHKMSTIYAILRCKPELFIIHGVTTTSPVSEATTSSTTVS